MLHAVRVNLPLQQYATPPRLLSVAGGRKVGGFLVSVDGGAEQNGGIRMPVFVAKPK